MGGLCSHFIIPEKAQHFKPIRGWSGRGCVNKGLASESTVHYLCDLEPTGHFISLICSGPPFPGL